MASTYTPLATTTLGSNSNTLSFSSISSSYTDLVLIASYKMSGAIAVKVQFNSDTGSNYASMYIWADSSSANMQTAQSTNVAFTGTISTGTNLQDWTSTEININNYSNSTTYKTTLVRTAAYSAESTAVIGLWRNTNAITTITLTANSAGNDILSGSTFTLYGITAA